MSEAETKQVETQYGSVNVETVDCDSCGDTMLKEDANRFTIGGRQGYACSYCVREGPISFPERVRNYALPKDPDGYFFLCVMTAPILQSFIMVDILFGVQQDDFYKGCALATISAIVWVGVPLLVFYLL